MLLIMQISKNANTKIEKTDQTQMIHNCLKAAIQELEDKIGTKQGAKNGKVHNINKKKTTKSTNIKKKIQ